jgi:hypothetical protein
MKAILVLLLCAVALPVYGQTVVVPNLLNCILNLLNCKLSDTIDLSQLNANTILQFNLNSKTFVDIDTSFTVNSIIFGDQAATDLAASVLNISQNAVITVTNSIMLAQNTVVDVAGQVVIAGNTTIASGASFIADAGSVVSFNGGVYVASESGSGQQGLIINSGATVTISADSTINGLFTLAQNSALTIQTGVVTSAKSIVAAGNTTVKSALSFTSSALTYTQSSGYLFLNSVGSTIAANAAVNAAVSIGADAFLKGNGNVTGDLNIVSSGTIAAGNSPGTVYCNGNFALTSTSTFELEIASATNYDRVIVGGTATINGILYAKLLDNYSPKAGDEYTFITSVGKVSGDFSIVHGDLNSNIGKFSDKVNDHSVVASYNSASAVVASVFVTIFAIALVTL